MALAFAPCLTGSISRTHDFDDRLLAAHNRERANLGIPLLQWDPHLSASAAKWADHLGATGGFEHSPDEPGQPVRRKSVGRNP